MIASSIENSLSIRLVLFLLKVVHLVSQKITVNVMYRVKHLAGSLGHLGLCRKCGLQVLPQTVCHYHLNY